jgi:hypothetical protein
VLESGRIHNLTIDQLTLDPLNPRLPEEIQGADQLTLAKFISRAYEPLSVAISIAEHGYFPSEPLIAIPEGDHYNVVEGNRRLTALLGLTDATIRSELDLSRQWEEVAGEAVKRKNIPVDIPVLIVADRKLVAPIIGYRHIAGILPWEPFAKARFIASLIDDEELDFSEVAGLVGERKGDVQNHYRNFAVVKQAKNEFDLHTTNVEDNFGVFTAAMNLRQLRGFIGAPDPAQVAAGTLPVPESKTKELEELLVWIGGDSDDKGRVIGESRDLKFLAKVVSNEKGLASLRKQGDLKTALDISNESSAAPRQRLVTRLQVAKSSLQNAAEIIDEVETDPEIEALISDCFEATETLRDFIEP